ncbi:MAG: DUF4145 domain-containing protein [Roseiarcus sp.]|uniref:DUF4145 domain-containing protein n=1 Tax=Roseiarcus sp. TaxID=1969460 RepID=UPI003C44ECD3
MTKEVWAPCSSCVRSTSHKILYETAQHDEDWTLTYAMLECLGCHRICLLEIARYVTGDSEQIYYPSPVSRKEPEWVDTMVLAGLLDNKTVDGRLGSLLREIYQAVHGRQYRLAAMGIRALLEQLMVSQVGDLSTFEQKLDAFMEQGYISLVQFDAMKATIEVGHAAMHRGYEPNENDVKLALDIVEGVMAPLFHHIAEAGKMVDRVPPRVPRK